MQKTNGRILDEVYLSNHKEFVKINNQYYGGDQRWLWENNRISKFWSDRSCGVVAASNTLHYMSKSGSLNIKKEEFVNYTGLIYGFITPRIYGIPSIPVMIRGLRRFSRANGLEITSYPLVKPTMIQETVEYIKKGLSKNAPIMMLTWNTKIRNLTYHWVTITGYYMGDDDHHYVIISNYGEKEIISINQWIKEKSIYKGLLYFTIEDY